LGYTSRDTRFLIRQPEEEPGKETAQAKAGAATLPVLRRQRADSGENSMATFVAVLCTNSCSLLLKDAGLLGQGPWAQRSLAPGPLLPKGSGASLLCAVMEGSSPGLHAPVPYVSTI
jgi:hypothetical protein